MDNIFNEQEIKKCVENYIANMKDVDASRSKMGVHRLIFMEERDEFLTKINGYIDSCILNKYYMQRIELLEEDNNYSESAIEELLNIYRVNDVKNKEDILNKIYEKRFYIPELTSDLTERSWGFTHTIWSRMSSCRTDRDNKFEEVVKKMLEESNSIGRHRIESLNKQYGINIDEK